MPGSIFRKQGLLGSFGRELVRKSEHGLQLMKALFMSHSRTRFRILIVRNMLLKDPVASVEQVGPRVKIVGW